MVDSLHSEQSRPSEKQIVTSSQKSETGEGEKNLVKNLFKWSFYYSQGNPIMQKDIFRVLTYYHPGVTSSSLVVPEVAKTTAQYVSALSRSDTGLHDESITSPIKDARDRQDTMKIIMEKPEAHGTKDADLLTFVSDWIRRDLEYVTSDDGRPHRNVLRSDVFSSQFFNVFFLGEEPKPGYEHMMHDVKTLVNKFMTMDRQSLSRLSEKEQERIRTLLYSVDSLRRAYNRHSTANSAWEEAFKKEKGADAKIHEPIVLPETWEKGMEELGIVRRLQQK